MKWQFWIDRGGTFTDIVALHPNGYLLTHKLLSDNPQHYQDAAVQGIRDILGLAKNEPLPTHQIAAVKILVDFAPCDDMKRAFATAHQQRFGFIRFDKSLIVEAVSVEVIGQVGKWETTETKPVRFCFVKMVTHAQTYDTPVYSRDDCSSGQKITGPAIIIEQTGTTLIEPGWQAEITPRYDIVLTRHKDDIFTQDKISTHVDPIRLEIFNNLFMSIASQMGATLANTAYSVNIKERLDFSCAVFDQKGQLIANAPHITIHLGSMSDSVQTVIQTQAIQPGDVFVLNNPYHGGTHLPDVTVITPVFAEKTEKVLFYVASRGHHADIGGITPGSMPPHSHTLHEEGIIIDVFKLVEQGQLRETEMRELLSTGPYPTRNVEQNLADLRAKIAANATGVQELHNMVQHFSLEIVQAYMQHVQDNAEAAVRQLLGILKEGVFRYELDNGAAIQVKITIDKQQRSAIIDFNGTSKQQKSNFNAPVSVCKAAVLYVFRTLVEDDIPMNAGCLKPLQIIIMAWQVDKPDK